MCRQVCAYFARSQECTVRTAVSIAPVLAPLYLPPQFMVGPTRTDRSRQIPAFLGDAMRGIHVGNQGEQGGADSEMKRSVAGVPNRVGSNDKANPKACAGKVSANHLTFYPSGVD